MSEDVRATFKPVALVAQLGLTAVNPVSITPPSGLALVIDRQRILFPGDCTLGVAGTITVVTYFGTPGAPLTEITDLVGNFDGSSYVVSHDEVRVPAAPGQGLLANMLHEYGSGLAGGVDVPLSLQLSGLLATGNVLWEVVGRTASGAVG